MLWPSTEFIKLIRASRGHFDTNVFFPWNSLINPVHFKYILDNFPLLVSCLCIPSFFPKNFTMSSPLLAVSLLASSLDKNSNIVVHSCHLNKLIFVTIIAAW